MTWLIAGAVEEVIMYDLRIRSIREIWEEFVKNTNIKNHANGES